MGALMVPTISRTSLVDEEQAPSSRVHRAFIARTQSFTPVRTGRVPFREPVLVHVVRTRATRLGPQVEIASSMLVTRRLGHSIPPRSDRNPLVNHAQRTPSYEPRARVRSGTTEQRLKIRLHRACACSRIASCSCASATCWILKGALIEREEAADRAACWRHCETLGGTWTARQRTDGPRATRPMLRNKSARPIWRPRAPGQRTDQRTERHRSAAR